MIGRLKGTVAAVGEGQALIDVGGVGYLIHAGSRTLSKLAVNEAAEVFVETQMSESAIRLFGFVSEIVTDALTKKGEPSAEKTADPGHA